MAKEKMSENTYDAFSSEYDLFVNWSNRLKVEMPFLTKQLDLLKNGKNEPLSVLDAACGTGMHAIALTKTGYRTAGADFSPQMIRQAHGNANAAGVSVDFQNASFGQFANTFQNRLEFPFDAILCLGNSLPHLLSLEKIGNALSDFAACLQPGGLLILQNRNFDAVLANQERWFPPQAFSQKSQDWLFLRFYDFLPDGLIAFHILRLHRIDGKEWKQEISSMQLFPLRQDDIQKALINTGFDHIRFFGELAETPFDPRESGNLVLTARKRLAVN